MIKKIIGVQILIMLCFTPFIYSNNAEAYRYKANAGMEWGHAFGSSFWWPSYLFSVEPEVDGSSVESFEASMIEILKFRKDKFFAGNRGDKDAQLMYLALGSCLTKAGFDTAVESINSYLFSEELDEELSVIRQEIMDKMDGYDFGSILKEGYECRSELLAAS